MTIINPDLLPTGLHYDLHVEHELSGDGGSYTGGGWKLCWHTTEGLDLREMVRVLRDKRAEPHFCIGIVGTHRKFFTAVQMLPLNQSARALEHPSGTAETNRANVVQVEICGYANAAANWSDKTYSALGALALMIEHRRPIHRSDPRAFTNTPHRFSEDEWIKISGHVGHEHCPSQPSGHWDPAALAIGKVFKAMEHYAK